jgi:capsular polysaccharide biosynthesis protein
VIKTYNFPNETVYAGKLIIEAENTENLKSCKKSGTWIKLKFFGKSIHFWTSIERRYFKNISNYLDTIVANQTVITTAKLVILKSVKVIHNKKDGSSLNLYNSKIKRNRILKNNEKGFYLNVKGSESFQHFVAETLPILGLTREFLIGQPELQIIMPQPLPNFKTHKYFFERLGITNPIRYIEKNNLCFEELYIIELHPFNAIYATPSTLYKNVYESIHTMKESQALKMDNLVVFLRNENTRNFANLPKIKQLFEKYANELNLNLIFVDSNAIQANDLVEILENAKYVFGAHGGANYNMIWAHKDTTLIEFIPTNSTDSLQHLVLSSGQKYFPYAIAFDKRDFSFEISEIDLDRIFAELLRND